MFAAYFILIVLITMLVIAVSYTPRGFLLPGIGLAVKVANLISRVVTVPYDPAVRRKIGDENANVVAGRTKGPMTVTEDVLDLGDHSIRVRRYLPQKAKEKKVILYFHGGGYVLGSLDAIDPVARALAIGTRTETWSVGYRLAPEHPYPAALDDAFDAYLALRGELLAREGQWKIFVSGDSAGGHLAVTLCLKLKKKGLTLPSAQILFYPVTDFASFTTESYRKFETGFILGKRDMEWFRALLLPGNCPDTADPLVSPLHAEDLSGLPQALVITAEFDVLRDEGEAFARKLALQGVKTELVRFRGVVHGFLGLSRFSTAGFHAIKTAARFIKKGTP